jgi:LPXTG-site transpeptidase (sortase) family protein
VTDSKPAQIASWTWTCAPGTPAAYHCDGASAGANDFSDSIDLPYGETLTYNVYAQVTPTLALPPTTLVNTVTVSTPGYTETNPNNNTATDTDQPASLLITKDDGVSIVIAGDTLTYQVVIQNNGGVKLDSMTVTDTLPADVTFVKAMQGSVSIPPSTKVGNVLTWTSARIPSLGNLGVGASTSFDIVVKVNSAPAASTLTNIVTVTDSHTGSTGTARDTDTIAKTNLKTLTGTSEVDSGSLIPANPEPVLIGEILTYTVQLTVPAGTMQSLKATDVLDQGLAYVRCDSISAGTLTTDLSGGFNAACTNGLPPTNPLVTAQPPTDANSINQGRRMVFDLGNVTNPGPNDQILTLTYKVIVLDIKSNVNGTKNLNNHVVWTWNATSSLSGEATPVSVTEPVLKITKKADPTTAVLGTPINFTLDVAHTSQSTAPAYTVEVKDILPTGLTYVPGSYSATGLAPTTFNYDASTRTLRFDWDVIPLGQNVQITYKAIFIGPSPTINTVGVEWTSIRIDPTNPNLPPNPVQRSVYNINSTERWYNPLNTVPNNYHAVSKVTIQVPQSGLPDTGFAPGQVSNIPAQPSAKAYTSLDGMQIEIPALGLYIPVTGVPYVDGRWDLTWLSNQAGYLEGTTYPGQVGTAGITGHVTLADGTPGPFHDLGKLKWGDQIILHLGGQKYIYELRELHTVSPSDLSVFKNDGYTWLTLITCSDFTPVAQAYINRTAARAVLVRIENDSSAGTTKGPDKLP